MFDPSERSSPNRLSRRKLLQLMGVSGGGLVLAACGATSGNASQAQQKLNSTKFDIPSASGNFPTSPVKLRWVDSGDQKAVFFDAFFPALQKKFSNVSVSYDGTSWNTIQQELSLGLRNGTAPNVMQLPPLVTPGEAVQNGWLAALDDFVPNWPKVKAAFPPGTFAAGITDFSGKTYGYPWTSNQRMGTGLLYNTTYLKQAGYDGSKVLSWTEFRKAAKKVTTQGGGKYYGIILGIAQHGVISGWVNTLAQMAGGLGALNGVPFDWKTGTYQLTSDINQEATELLLSMKSDGSIFPDSISYDNPHARGAFPDGVAAMQLQGPWNIPEYLKDNPGFKFGFNLPPQKDPKNFYPLSYGPGGSNTWFVTKNSTPEQLAVVGEVFAYLGTLKGQTEWADFDGAGDPPQFKQVTEHAHMDKISELALKLGYQYTALAPDPVLKTQNISTYNLFWRAPKPDWDGAMVGLYTGQIKTSVADTLKSVQDSYDAAMDDAITKSTQEGAPISRNDFKFPNWNPSKPYPYPAK